MNLTKNSTSKKNIENVKKSVTSEFVEKKRRKSIPINCFGYQVERCCYWLLVQFSVKLLLFFVINL